MSQDKTVEPQEQTVSNELDSGFFESSEENKPIEVTLFGQKYTFDSREKMTEAFENLFRQAVAEARAVGAREASQAQTQNQAQNQNQVKGEYVSGGEPLTGGKPDPAKFVELLEKDPAAAFDYVDQYRYGIPAAQIRPAVKSTLKTVADMVLAIEADRFVRETPEYSPSDSNMRALLEVLRESRLPPTSDGMKAAFHLAIQKGVIKPAQPSQQAASYPPPSPGRSIGTTGPALNWDKIRSMKTEDLRKEIERLKDKFKSSGR